MSRDIRYNKKNRMKRSRKLAEFNQVSGRDIGDIKVYALSTCGWCKKAKSFFSDHNIKYAYIDVDKLSGNDVEAIRKEQLRHNPSGSFPTIVIGEDRCIIGYDADALKALLEE